MRLIVVTTALVALAACGPSIPDSGPDSGTGVGFGSYSDYQAKQAAREAQLAGNTLPAASEVSTTSLGGASSNAASMSEGASIAAQTRAALGTDADDLAGNSGQPIIQASPTNPAPAVVNSAGISIENDFEAVGAERSIESDAARIAANRQQYQVAAVEALPNRTNAGGPNIVEYALQTNHNPGTQVYKRSGLNAGRTERNCAAFTGPDIAQIEFLKNGGPERDRQGLDPDGDGFACGWDPRPFRKAVRG
ncbi:hypothetical protein OO012_06225 [Rhodobacteraceae bacterium KMM 6894]|nr:hypothetical protein [Rhodobacteraceae bacterium KMM 6894]